MWPIVSFQFVNVTCLITKQLNWSHTKFLCPLIGHVHKCVYQKYKRSNNHCYYQLITKSKLWLTGSYNLPLKINLGFCIYRLSSSISFVSTAVCSSVCRRYEPLTVAVTFSYILLFLVVTCTGLYAVVAVYIY